VPARVISFGDALAALGLAPLRGARPNGRMAFLMPDDGREPLVACFSGGCGESWKQSVSMLSGPGLW